MIIFEKYLVIYETSKYKVLKKLSAWDSRQEAFPSPGNGLSYIKTKQLACKKIGIQNKLRESIGLLAVVHYINPWETH